MVTGAFRSSGCSTTGDAGRRCSERTPRHPATFVQSLARGLGVIRAFDAEHPELASAMSPVAPATRAAAPAGSSSRSRRSATSGSDGRTVRADTARARTGLQLPVRVDAARDCAAAPRDTCRAGSTRRLGGRARRRRHRLHRPRADAADHERPHHDRYALPGLCDVDGAGAAGRDAGCRGGGGGRGIRSRRLTTAHCPIAPQLLAELTGYANRDGRSSTGSSSRAAFDRRAGASAGRRRGGCDQRLDERPEGFARASIERTSRTAAHGRGDRRRAALV